MNKVSGILNTKISTKDQILVVALTAAITAAVAVPFALAMGNDAKVSANAPTTSQTTKAVESCYEAVTGGVKASTAKAATSTHTTHTVVTGANNSGSTQSGNSGQGNANNTTGGSAAANGNNQSNTGGLIGGVNAIVPVSALNNNNVLSGNNVSVLSGSNVLQTVTTQVPVVTSVLSTVGINL